MYFNFLKQFWKWFWNNSLKYTEIVYDLLEAVSIMNSILALMLVPAYFMSIFPSKVLQADEEFCLMDR